MIRSEFTIIDLLLNTADRFPENSAVVDGPSCRTYSELRDDAARFAQLLREHGVQRRDRVGIYMTKSTNAVIAMLGIAWAGAAFVNIHPDLKSEQVNHIMTDCGIATLVCDAARADSVSVSGLSLAIVAGDVDERRDSLARTTVRFDEEPGRAVSETDLVRSTESDVATIIYTSGSTGQPKGIVLTHRNLVAGAQIVSEYLENTAEDRVLSVLPFSFDYGLNQLMTMLKVGGTLVLQKSVLPGDIVASLERERITGLAGVPPFWALLVRSSGKIKKRDFPYLRYMTNSGGAIPSRHLNELREMFPETRIFLMYGLTEAFRSTYVPPEEIGRGPGCIGKAIPGCDVWVVDASGRECAPGEEGELVHRGPTTALGYWNDPERTSKVFRPNPLAPRELHHCDTVVYSGDFVKRDEDGFIYFIGRKDEQIKTRGFRVSPQEVEELLCTVPQVNEAVAFGRPDETLGQAIVTVVTFREEANGFEANDLRRACATLMPPHLVPADIHIMGSLPRTPSGKIDRSSLKHDYSHA